MFEHEMLGSTERKSKRHESQALTQHRRAVDYEWSQALALAGSADMINRRKILGPAADITHPEFGRPNTPEETFAIRYTIEEREIDRIPEEDADFGKTPGPVFKCAVLEEVRDFVGRIVSQRET